MMVLKVIALVLLVAVVSTVYVSLPDIRRYLRMRRM